MSFIYNDKSLLQSLIDAGEKSIKKTAQQLPPEELAKYTLAKKLAQQLMRQVDPNSAPAATAPIGSESGAQPTIDRKNLETLGDFLKWASDNGITWEGKRIAYVYPDPNQKGPEGYWKFRTYTIDRDRDAYDRTAVEVPAYADKDALIKVISYLRDSEEAKKEKVFSVMLGSLIKQANQFLEKNEQIQPRSEQKPSSTFNANDPVDGFKDSTLNMKDPYAGIQDFMKATDPNTIPVRMTWSDVSSKAGLIDWMRGMKFIGDDGKPVDPTAPGGDPCGAIHILYLRSKYLAQYATDRLRPGFAKLEQAYLKQIQTLGPQFDNNGQPCAVVKPGTAGPEQPNQNQNQNQQGDLSGLTPAVLQQLSSLKPFNSQFISFPEIEKFLDLYGKVANNANVSQEIEKLKGYIQTYKSFTGMGSDTIQLYNLTTQQFKGQLRDPSRAIIMADTLYDIIQYSGQLYQRLVTSLQTVAQDSRLSQSIDYRGMQQQIAPGGPQLTNINQLNRLKYNLEQEWKNQR